MNVNFIKELEGERIRDKARYEKLPGIALTDLEEF